MKKKLQLLKENIGNIVRGAAVDTLESKAGKAGVIGATVLGMGGTAKADVTAPLDFSTTATTIAGYVPAAATAGLTIFAAVFGVMIIKRVFMTVA